MPDYSCNVTITNNTAWAMVLVNTQIIDGYWTTNPPSNIQPKSTQSFRLSDNAGPVGSEGYATYAFQVPNNPVNTTLHFSCPVWSSNVFTVTISNPKVVSASTTSSGPGGHPLSGTATYSPSLFEAWGLAGYISEEALRALEGDGIHDEKAWEVVHKELTAMKDAEKWTIAKK